MSGFKIGELLLKIAFQYCINNQIFETYLTHYRKEEDGLINLLEEFGFEMVGTLGNKEEVYLKKFIPEEKELSPIDFAKKYYPSFKDSPSIQKFVVPIRPKYHERLFPDYLKRQMRLNEYSDINIQGNTTKKAYLSHSKIRKIKSGDILLFYRSGDQKKITSVGVVERILRTRLSDSILRFVGRRSVYSDKEIKKFTQKPVLAILFRHHLNLPNPLNLDVLRESNILNYAPQSIIEINQMQYELIKKGGRLDERFIVS